MSPDGGPGSLFGWILGVSLLLGAGGMVGCTPPPPSATLQATEFPSSGAVPSPANSPSAAPSAKEPDGLWIHVLDVGQGDAILIEEPQGRRVLLDAGPSARVVDLLRELCVDTLDLFVTSHNHADHIGGAAAVLEAFPVRFYLDNGVPHTTVTYQRTLEALARRDVPLLEAERRSLEVGAITLEIFPPPGDLELGHNANSLGVRLHMGDFAALFAGDAEEPLWGFWMDRFPEAFSPVDLLKGSHHGSRNGDVEGVLAQLRPPHVVISAGRGNSYGHPHAEALARYRAVGAQIHTTAESGSLHLRVSSEGILEFFASRGQKSVPRSCPTP